MKRIMETVKLYIATSPFWVSFAVFLEYIGLDSAMFQLLLMLMASDFILGIIAAYQLNSFTSRGAWNGMLKKLSTLLVLLMSAYYSKVMGVFFGLFSVLVFSIIIHAETLSVWKNFYIVRTGERIKEVDILKPFFAGIIKKIESMLKALTDVK